ncbi:MAG TPA: hypothetical protein PLW95_00705 [bacterium]|nr:hypothetical protein [bacterium]
MENIQKSEKIQVSYEDTTQRQHLCIPAIETSMSRRYLSIMQNWISFGMEYFHDWQVCPHCGHFFGGVFWYGMETSSPLFVIAAVVSSPEYNQKVTGYTKKQLINVAVKALRYLCFTHDTGPQDCVRPEKGLGNATLFGTKWGEKGKGFFPESQCGVTLYKIVISALILRKWIDRETWMMIAKICADYLERFVDMSPKSGVYYDTQAEENTWTSLGLTAAMLFLENHKDAKKWEESAKHWMFCAAIVPDDLHDDRKIDKIDKKKSIRELCSKKVTFLPDFMAENHGIVHPNYTASVILGDIINLYRLFGRKEPSHWYWHRQEVYDNLKFLSDKNGIVHPVQGMDWPYLTPSGLPSVHCFAHLYLKDKEGAYFENAALNLAEKIIKGNKGRMWHPDIVQYCHNIQDPMLLWEHQICNFVPLYLAHRICAKEKIMKVPSQKIIFAKYVGVRKYPHSGFIFHKHKNGQTSFSWRNQIMALPVTSDGFLTIAPSFNSILGKIKVKGYTEHFKVEYIHINEKEDGFTAIMRVILNDGCIKQDIMLASLPDGKFVCKEVFWALKGCTVEYIQQGYIEIMNERFPELKINCTGSRKLYTPSGVYNFPSMVKPNSKYDKKVELKSPPWLNLDDRMGIIIASEGHQTLYHNRHFFKPYHAVTDELFLNMHNKKNFYKKNSIIADILFMFIPGQNHKDTPKQLFITPLSCSEGIWGALTDNNLIVGNLDVCSGSYSIEFKRQKTISVFPGITKIENGKVSYEVDIIKGQSLFMESLFSIETNGFFIVSALPGGLVYITNNGRAKEILSLDGEKISVDAGKTILQKKR